MERDLSLLYQFWTEVASGPKKEDGSNRSFHMGWFSRLQSNQEVVEIDLRAFFLKEMPIEMEKNISPRNSARRQCFPSTFPARRFCHPRIAQLQRNGTAEPVSLFVPGPPCRARGMNASSWHGWRSKRNASKIWWSCLSKIFPASFFWATNQQGAWKKGFLTLFNQWWCWSPTKAKDRNTQKYICIYV